MAAAESSSSNYVVRRHEIASMLDELDELDATLDPPQKEYQRSSGEAAAGFFRSKPHKKDEVELQDLIGRLQQLRAQLRFVCRCLDLICIWSDADRAVPDIRSVVPKAQAIADEITKWINDSHPPPKSRSSKSKLEGWIREMSDSNPEIARVFGLVLGSFMSMRIRSPLQNLSSWIKFVEPMVEDTNFAHDRLRMFTAFVSSVHQGFPLGLTSVGDNVPDRNQAVVEDFFHRVASIIYRTACLACFGWFGATDHASEINELIDDLFPDNTKSLDSLLKFLKVVQEIFSHGEIIYQLAEVFCHSFLHKTSTADIPEDLYWDLLEWLMFLINKADQEPVNQDEECFLAEVKHMIAETIHKFNFLYYSRISSFERKQWLLRADRFLQAAILEFPEAGQIDNLVNSLRVQEPNDDQSEEFVVFANKMASDIRSLFQSFRAQEIDECKVRSSISLLLSRIVLFRAEPVLMELLLYRNGSVLARCNDQLQAVLEGFQLFTPFAMDEHAEIAFHEEKIFRSIERAARRIIRLSYSFVENEFTEETAEKAVTDLLDEIVNSELAMFYPQIPRNIFPKQTVGMGFLDSVLQNLLELLKRHVNLIPVVKDSMTKIQESLESLLTRTSQKGTELLESEDLGSRIANMTYGLDYVVDSIELGIGPQWQHLVWLIHLRKEIDLVKMLVTRNLQENASENGACQIPHISSHVLRASTPESDRPVVSLVDQEKVIIGRLRQGSSQRNIVSIVGMPGLGKTTIAKKVYENPNVVHHFHCRAWCFVSQSYGKRELLLNLLRDIQGFSVEIQQMDDADLELKLFRCLKRRRYLIVMDDVWDVGVWKDLDRSFPDDKNGSRIMITTRLRKVALDSMPDSEPHPLRALSWDESWKLMEMRIFRKEGYCPKELLDVGKEIAEHCKGLPLAVIAVAGILEKTEKKHSSWKRISQQLNTLVIDDPVTRCRDILELSYSHLPAHLKACFLYFGAFQEDRDVPVTKLIRLWMAEGFIPKTDARIMEEIGEDYLFDLIDRSLVMISKTKSIGGVKACHIHDLLLDLCRSISKGDKFLQMITKIDEPYASFLYLDDDEDFDPDDHSIFANYEGHRVCIHLKRKLFVCSRPLGPCTRTLLFLASDDTYPWRPYDISFISQNFQLLRVLDLESINLAISVPDAIEFLLILRYLALSGYLDSIPQSISKLWKLQTLIVKGLSGKVVLPDNFWSMRSLRHVHVKNQAAFKLKGDKFESSNQLENLVTLSSPTLSYGKDTEMMLRKLPNLRKLRCTFRETWDSSGQCNPFPRLEFITELESLNIKYSGRGACNPHQFNLPLNLRKLTLWKFHLSMNHLSSIGKLPKLEVLKILSGSLEEAVWDMNEGEFRELKFLKLDSLNVVKWNASSDHLPQLEQLVLWNCKDFEEVPQDIFDICTLRMIEVRRCSQSLEEHIRNLEVEGLQVQITH